MNRFLKQSKFGKLASGLLLIGLVLSLSLAGASPSVHKLIHADAGAPDHNCAITLFTKGHVSPATVATFLAGLVVFFGGVSLLAETFLLSLANYRYSSSRAPPCFS